MNGAIGDVAIALLQEPGSGIRRDMAREIDRQIWRALWRAERRGRRKPFKVRQAARWVKAQRRTIAFEVIRALKALGAGAELASAIASSACTRFPRDGVVIADDGNRPRARGEAPRQKATNPRARGTAPRQRGTSPRQKRAAADPNHQTVTVGTTGATGSDRNVDRAATVATDASDSPAVIRPMEELAPEWEAIKAGVLEGLTPAERVRAKQAGRIERERIHRSQNSNPNPPAPPQL